MQHAHDASVLPSVSHHRLPQGKGKAALQASHSSARNINKAQDTAESLRSLYSRRHAIRAGKGVYPIRRLELEDSWPRLVIVPFTAPLVEIHVSLAIEA